MKHKHAELIKAWADGAIIQLKLGDDTWVDSVDNDPSWSVESEYRIKPEPKPDVVKYLGTQIYGAGCGVLCNDLHTVNHWNNQLRLTFDGETGKLKSAEVLS